MKKIGTCVFLFFTFSVIAQSAIDKVINIKVVPQIAPAKITLLWNPKITATGYTISRKLRDETSWALLATNTSNADTTYADNTINLSTGYEYKVNTIGGSVDAFGYTYAAIKLPPKHAVGRLLVLIDSAYINYCAAEIKQYIEDIIKEGWRVSVKYIARTTSVQEVKQSVKNMYLQDAANTKGLFLIGHVPVPYSGAINPDGHPEHYGAWPTDWYYADTASSSWTDVNVNVSTAGRSENNNVPGDGKFDQSTIPNAFIHFFVTRVDVFNMPTINANDSLLMKNYLQKDHAYRSMQKTFRMRALVDDNFGYFSGEAFAQNGYRNGINLLTKDSVFDADYMTAMNSPSNSYLWSYGCGGGWYQGAGGVGSTTDFQSGNLNSVFTMLFGSYFGDWDNADNFLRAPLASPSSILTNCWAGRPNWFFHAMGLGESIGFSVYDHAKLPYLYAPFNYGTDWIHNEFLGDPTLRMYLFAAAENLSLSRNGNNVNVSWTASPDPDVVGYHIYKSTSITDTFKLLNPDYRNVLNYVDVNPSTRKNVYMVRAVKLQNTMTGSVFVNLSSGIIDSINLPVGLPLELMHFTASESNCKVNITWDVAREENMDRYEVWRSVDGLNFRKKIAVIAAKGKTNGVQKYDCIDVDPSAINFYQLVCIDKDGTKKTSKVCRVDLQACGTKTDAVVFIYPNPVKDLLYVDVNDNQSLGTVQLMITDVNGKTILTQKNQVQGSHAILKASISQLSAGVYFATIEMQSGLRKVYKFEKQK